MQQAVPPPDERFDPILGRWETPGGPLHDPARDAVDPDHGEPLELVEPIPPELEDASRAHLPERAAGEDRPGRRRPLSIAFWLIAALVAVGASAVILIPQVGYCPDPGECTTVYGGGPAGWLIAVALIGFAVHAARRAFR